MRYFLTFTAILLTNIALCQVSGVITIGNSDLPVSGAVISVEGHKDYAITNHNGFFQLTSLDQGNYILSVRAIGFVTDTKVVELQSQQQEINFQLREDVIAIDDITVTSFQNLGGYMGSLDLPPSTNYVSPKALKEMNTTDINKVLFNIPGVNYQEEDGFGLRPNIGLRGTSSERSSKVTIMEDGILAAPAPYASPSAYYFPTVGRMSAIEIQKGSSQIENGPFTTGGVINFVSTSIPDSFEAGLRANLGEFTTGNFHGNLGGKLGEQFGYMIESFQYGSSGFKHLPDNENTGFYKQDYLTKFQWKSKESASFQQLLNLKAGLALETSDETYLGLTSEDFSQHPFNRYAGSQNDQMNTDQNQISLSHWMQPNHKLSVETALYRNEFSRNWYKLDKVYSLEGEKVGISSLLQSPASYVEQYDFVTGNNNSGNVGVLDVKANNRNYTSRGLQTKLNWTIKENQNLELGARIHYDEMDRFQWVDGYAINNGKMTEVQAGTPGTESNRIESANALASFATYALHLNQFSINVGMRFENINLKRKDYGKQDPDRTGSDLSIRENKIQEWIPGIGMQYALSDDQQLFAGIHKGFAPPGSAPDTDAENSVNYELGYRFLKGNTFANATVFYNDYSNLLGADNLSNGGLGSGDLFNGGQANTYGLELGMQHYFVLNDNASLPFNLSYTYTHAEFANDFESDFEFWGNVQAGDRLPYLSPHQLNSSLAYQSKLLAVIFRTNYLDDMRITPGQNSTTDRIDSRLLFNVDGQFRVNKKMTILGKVNNILNETYVVSQRPSGLRPGMPRAFSLGFDVSF